METDNNRVISRVKNVFNTINKNNEKASILSDQSFYSNKSVRNDDLVNAGNNVNIIVGPTKITERNTTTHIGCMTGGNLDKFKVDIDDDLTDQNAFEYCKKSAQYANQPFDEQTILMYPY